MDLTKWQLNPRCTCLYDFEITRMFSDQIALHSVQLPLYIINKLIHIDQIYYLINWYSLATKSFH